MKRSIKRVITAGVSLTMAAAIAVTPASAAYYSNSVAFDATGESYAIPEAYRFYSVINRFEYGIGTLSAPSDICFDEEGMLYVVDKDNSRILIMNGDGQVSAILGGETPDQEEEEEALSEEDGTEDTEPTEEPENSEEPAVAEEPAPTEEPTGGETGGTDGLLGDIIVGADRTEQLERTELTVPVSDLTAIQYLLSKTYMERFLDGSAEGCDGKSVEKLTISFTGDITIDNAADAAKLAVTTYRYRYNYGEKQETISIEVCYEIAEGSTFTVNTDLDLGSTNMVNNGKLVIRENGRLNVTDCTLSSEGEVVQYCGGAIDGTQASRDTGVSGSFPEGTKVTYMTDGTNKLDFVYFYLNNPEGICVDKNGRIYICDTENRRVITMASDFTDIQFYTEEMIRENATLLGTDYNFTPSKIGISMTGMMYILNKSSYKGFFTLNEEGEFCGFVGATKVTASVTDVLTQIFGSASQKNALANRSPAPATNLYVVDNMIYSVVKASATEPDPKRIMKINVVGSDLFPDGNYVISSYSTTEQKVVESSYVDICVDDYGIVTALDSELGYIVQLNQLGEIIACFGGKSNRQGQFMAPTALDINPANDRIYVADSMKGSIQVFEPTNFINLVHKASELYFEGLYAEAVDLWEEVAALDETYDLAHVGIAESYYGDGYNLKAMEKFSYAWNYEGYDKAFSDFRLSLFRYYFAPVVLSILALVILVCFGFLALKRRADELYK